METTIERLGSLTEKQVMLARSINYMRWLSCLYESKGMDGDARYRYGLRYPRAIDDLSGKSAVAAGTTLDATWASPLAALKRTADAFLEYVRPRTLLGKIQNLRQVPFGVSVASQTGDGTYGWVGQGAPKPVGALAFASVTLGIAKASGILVVSEELAQLSAPGSETTLRDELSAGLAYFLDVQFVDPTVAEVTNVSPGSITNGTTPIAASGVTAAAALTDIKALIAAFTAANPDVEFAVLLMSPANAVALAVATNSQTLTIAGGTLFGVPVVTSTALGTSIVLVDAAGILFGDDGGLEISVSRNATVQMDSTPADPTVAATVLISLFQNNLAGFKVDRMVNWKRGRASAVKYLSGAAYV